MGDVCGLPPGDDGEVIGKTQFEVVPAEDGGGDEVNCLVKKLRTDKAPYNNERYKLGEDVIVSGLFSASPSDRQNNTPVEMRYKGPEDASYTAEEVKPKYSSYGNCVFLSFELVLKNIWQVGTWKVSAVYPPLDIDRSTNFEVVAGEGGSDKIDTWINSVRTPAGKNIPNGGSTASKVVTVDFQGTVSGRGSHIDLRIDNGPYIPVASPHTITGLSFGKHTIYLKAINQQGQEDPTPAKWTFTVTGGPPPPPGLPDTWINWVRAKPNGGPNIPYGGSTPSSTVIVDFQGTVAGKGSHIDLKIDSGSYVPVASPHTITGLSDGPHTIYPKAVNQAGKADPTPAKWRFTVTGNNNND